jgi:hypothetical protein
VVPVGNVTAYSTLRVDAAVVFPKWAAARTASAAICACVAFEGAALPVSAHTPAREPPVG